MLLHPGVQERLFIEAPTAAGTLTKEISVQSDTVMVTLFVDSTAGDLTVNVWGFTDDAYQRKILLFSFPTISSPTTNLVLKRAAITTARVLVEAVYTDTCSYEIYVRAIMAGLSETKILGAAGLTMSQKDVPTGAPTNIIPASLQDRAGVVVKNWSSSGTVYLGATTLEATISNGYPLGPKDAIAVDVSAGVSIYGVADAGVVDLRLSQSGG